MKVQYVSISPTLDAEENGCYSLTPELLAATGARYSRNNEGLDAIASKIDHSNLDKSVDNIFKMIDYGHASIADMAPIALFIDDISQFAAYYLWTLSPTAGGQECSTRYLKIAESSLLHPEDIGLPKYLYNDFDKYNKLAFNNYQIALEAWTELSKTFPNLTKIPKSLLDSKLEKDKKVVERMRRNFAFDRARVYLPLASKTGVMMVQSARAWTNIASHLQSHYLFELRKLGKLISENLALGAPRLLKHAKESETLKKYIAKEFNYLVESSKTENVNLNYVDNTHDVVTQSFLEVDSLGYDSQLITEACKDRSNRYSPFGNVINRSFARFCWIGISFGEIRDLNRHRTGNKYCPLMPLGFYTAMDQIPEENNDYVSALKSCAYSFNNTVNYAKDLLNKSIGEYIYFTSLGHQYYFEHSTNVDKFLYEMELRTGIGAHYKYAEHCKEILKLWYAKFPDTKNLIFEGSAEPE
jgi:thymidylate synthase ThyX